MAKVDLSFDAVHKTGTETTSEALGTFYTYEDQADATCTTTLAGFTLYDATIGKVALSAGDSIEYKGKNSATADGKMMLATTEGTGASVKAVIIATLTEGNPKYTATEDIEFYLAAGSALNVTQKYFYQIERENKYYVGGAVGLDAGDTLTWTGSEGTAVNPAAGYYAYFENIGNFDKGFDADDECIIVLDTKGNELAVLHDGEEYKAENECVVFLAALDDNIAISYDILPEHPQYEEEYEGSSGILAWKREKRGKMRFFLHIDNDSDDDIGYMEVEPSADAQGMKYLNMTGFDKLKIVSDGEVYECIVNEC